MPFVSQAQRRFLFSQHPEVAKRWSKKYGMPKNLPEKIGNKLWKRKKKIENKKKK